MHGTCKEPGECTCHPGWTGEDCSECVPLPDCQNGFCEKPLECRCEPGYEGQGRVSINAVVTLSLVMGLNSKN